MFRPHNFLFLSFLGWATIASTGCRKNLPDDTDNDSSYAADYVQLERSFNNIQDLADQAALQPAFGLKTTSRCANVTRDTLSTPRVLTIDFGPTNCLCNDGKYRRGKIIVHYTGRYADSGSRRDFSVAQYYVNDNQVLGTKSVVNRGSNSAGQPYFDVSINGSLVLANGNGTRSWSSTRTRTWTAGFHTPAWGDDEYDISGNAILTRPNSKSFSFQTLTALHRAVSCDWIQSGVLQITPAGKAPRTLDFGIGNCDSNATLTIHGRSRVIQLP